MLSSLLFGAVRLADVVDDAPEPGYVREYRGYLDCLLRKAGQEAVQDEGDRFLLNEDPESVPLAHHH